MNPRQKQLFRYIVEEYVKTAVPVGSKLIVDRYLKNVSSATIRNDMMELEKLGLISQPHTSAGRIPTEKGYRQYVEENVDLDGELSKKERDKILAFVETGFVCPLDKLRCFVSTDADEIKVLAKILAEKSGLCVVVGFNKNNFYYTGLSNLFSQPEFKDLNLVYNLSNVIDHLDEVMMRVYNEVNNKIQIKIGNENLFSNDCACVMIKVKNILLGIVGPVRMNYENVVKLINYTKTII